MLGFEANVSTLLSIFNIPHRPPKLSFKLGLVGTKSSKLPKCQGLQKAIFSFYTMSTLCPSIFV